MTVAEPTIRRFSRDEYHRMADTGFFDGQRVELIDGEVIQMPAQKDQHAFAVRLGDDALRRAFKTGCVILVQMPLDLGDLSEPEPDLAVVRGSLRAVSTHPQSAELVVEVSDTTLVYDQRVKASLYAS